MRIDLPRGTVTFLFTDIEGSTKLLQELRPEGYAAALAEHRRVIREAFAAEGGVEVDTQGDAFFIAFPTAPGALAAVRAMVTGLAAGPIRVRIGLHTGTPFVAEDGYVGPDVNRAARIAAAGHGGQVLVSSATAALVGLDSLRDLGEHRLKDLSAPERIYQLGDDEFPLLKTLHQTNLPIPSTPFVGRERELGEILSLLVRDDVRLLTLTGPGGTGKTRLAAQAAGALGDRYPDGVWWVPLASLREPELVLESASRTLGAKNGLAEHVADKRLLLLFDNFEHVLEAAGELAGLLSTCPNLELLATSREPLHLTGEQEYAVPPFVLQEAVGFFAARARAVDPAFEVDDAVPEICRRLDELPLALELAAARVKALSTAQILERLEHRLPLLTGGARDAPERQRTLRATIEWSYELLSPEEQVLFARLSVFRGGCTLDAAERVCDAHLDTLQSLVDKSLVRFSGGRYWMLETIREYASDRLDELDERHEPDSRHADYHLALAEQAEPHLRGAPKEWLDRLEQEHDNLRAAFDWLLVADARRAQGLVGALWRFWSIRGHSAEGHRRTDAALQADGMPTRERGAALNGGVVFALEVIGDVDIAKRRAEEALALHRALDDAWGAAISTQLLGNVHAEEGEWEAGLRRFGEALAAFRDLGDEHYVLLATRLAAWMHFELGDMARARALHEHVVESARAAGNRRMQATSLGALGEYALEEGRPADALPLLAESARLARGEDEPAELVIVLWRLARALALEGRARHGAQVFATAERLREDLGLAPFTWMKPQLDETRRLFDEALDADEVARAARDGAALSVDQALALALEPPNLSVDAGD